MKKTFATLFVAGCFIFISCSKENDKEADVDTEKVQEVLDFTGSPGSRVVAFNILTASEKAYAFKKHIQDNYEKFALTQEQKTLAIEAIKMIVPEMYMADKQDKYMSVVAKFGHKATQLFSVVDYVRLFQNIQAIDKESTSLKNVSESSGECFCKWESTCTAYADTKGPDCITGLNGCVATTSGCGWLWMSSCTGDCGRKVWQN